MQEILILHFCDRCIQADGTKVEATEQVEVAIARQTARLDLCAQCVETFLRPVRDLVRAREGVQRALDKSAGQELPGREPKPAHRTRCQCGKTMEIRQRGTHARNRHNGAEPQDLTWYLDDAEETWECSCGLPFPTRGSRSVHGRRTRHRLPEGRTRDAPAR